jgi:hypothetical protein
VKAHWCQIFLVLDLFLIVLHIQLFIRVRDISLVFGTTVVSIRMPLFLRLVVLRVLVYGNDSLFGQRLVETLKTLLEALDD